MRAVFSRRHHLPFNSRRATRWTVGVGRYFRDWHWNSASSSGMTNNDYYIVFKSVLRFAEGFLRAGVPKGCATRALLLSSLQTWLGFDVFCRDWKLTIELSRICTEAIYLFVELYKLNCASSFYTWRIQLVMLRCSSCRANTIWLRIFFEKFPCPKKLHHPVCRQDEGWHQLLTWEIFWAKPKGAAGERYSQEWLLTWCASQYSL